MQALLQATCNFTSSFIMPPLSSFPRRLYCRRWPYAQSAFGSGFFRRSTASTPRLFAAQTVAAPCCTLPAALPPLRVERVEFKDVAPRFCANAPAHSAIFCLAPATYIFCLTFRAYCIYCLYTIDSKEVSVQLSIDNRSD